MQQAVVERWKGIMAQGRTADGVQRRIERPRHPARRKLLPLLICSDMASTMAIATLQLSCIVEKR